MGIENLTVTIGYGPSLFDGRFGLAAKKPKLLEGLPPLPNENLDPNYVGGDIAIQACSDDPIVGSTRSATRADRDRHGRDALGADRVRQHLPVSAPVTPRNLLGFKDGTRNLDGTETAAHGQVRVDRRRVDQRWLRGGSFLVTRRIRMFIENWDRDRLGDQEDVIGRSKASGVPLYRQGGVRHPRLPRPRRARAALRIPDTAYIRLASPESNGGLHIRRRGYSYTDGIDPVRGTLLGGLFFAAYMKSPDQFITLQRKLGHTDALNEYIEHNGSGIFVCPPGLREGQDGRPTFLGPAV